MSDDSNDDDGVEQRFARLVAPLDYPMHIVTAASAGEAGGCLVGFAGQVSIHPPRYLVGISKKNHTYLLVTGAEALAVHLPAPEERALAVHFGEETGDEIDKLAGIAWRPAPDGVTPVLDGCARWFFGPIVDRVDLGDHLGVVVEPSHAEPGPGRPQLGFQSVRDVDPGHDP